MSDEELAADVSEEMQAAAPEPDSDAKVVISTITVIDGGGAKDANDLDEAPKERKKGHLRIVK